MAKLVHLTREQVEKGLKQHDKSLAMNEFLQEEHKRIEKIVAEEKMRRDAEYAVRREAQQVQKEAPK